MFCPSCGVWNRGAAAACIGCDDILPDIITSTKQPDLDIVSLRHVIGGRYSVSHRLGDGGMATVYYAIHTSLDRPVVLKVLHHHLARDPAMRERFRREAETAAQLVHPHICNIIDFGMTDNQVYTVMPFMSGGTLANRISGKRTLPPDQAASLIIQLSVALDYAHRHGLIHRDIKPDNILFDEDGNASITDFGIAATYYRSRMTGSGHVMGTPHYMSPEQARGLILDGRSDLYTLGVMLYEMLVGFVPFDGADHYSISTKHLSELPVAPHLIDSGLSPALSNIVLKCLEKDPARRFARGNDLADALITYLTNSREGTKESRRSGWISRAFPSLVGQQ